MAKYGKEVPVRPSKNGPKGTQKDPEGPRRTQKDPVRLSKLRQTSQAAFAASSYSSWLPLRVQNFFHTLWGGGQEISTLSCHGRYIYLDPSPSQLSPLPT